MTVATAAPPRPFAPVQGDPAPIPPRPLLDWTAGRFRHRFWHAQQAPPTTLSGRGVSRTALIDTSHAKFGRTPGYPLLEGQIRSSHDFRLLDRFHTSPTTPP